MLSVVCYAYNYVLLCNIVYDIPAVNIETLTCYLPEIFYSEPNPGNKQR